MAPRHILLVDDSRGQRSGLGLRLERSGYRVFHADTAEAALAAVRDHRPDAVILDGNLPDHHGLWVPRNLAAEALETAAPAWIILSGFLEPALEREALDLGIRDILYKPLDPSLLVARIEAVLRDRDERLSLQARWHEATRLAVTDDLTGLGNHRLLVGRISEEWHRSRRFGHSLALLMLDLDGFKALNDRFGHAAGDEALRIVGSRIREATRAYDVPCRQGGDEFAVILPQTDRAGARAVAERIRASLARPFVLVETPCVIGAGIGIASSEPNTGTSGRAGDAAEGTTDPACPEALMELADKELYEDKRRRSAGETSGESPERLG